MLKRISLIWILFSVLLTLPRAFDPKIEWGQVGKQSFSAAMARSYSTGKTVSGFARLPFPEPIEKEIGVWAEEVPIYSASVGWLARQFRSSPVVMGRLLSFCFYLLLIWGFFEFGKELERISSIKQARFLLPAIGAALPVFKIYSISIMPDLAMTSFCLWSWVWMVRKKRVRSFLFAMIACLFKYYAAFHVLGLIFFDVWSSKKKGGMDWIQPIILGVWAVAPAALYVLLFVSLGIPNPITEYAGINGHGHLGTVSFVLSLKFLSRMVTWSLVKNPSLPLGVFSVAGLVLCLRQRKTPLRALVLAQILSGMAFMAIFATSYFVHDYYGLQFALLTTVLSGVAFDTFLRSRWAKKQNVIGVGAALITAVWCLRVYVEQTHRLPFYSRVAQEIEAWIPPHERGFVISDRAVVASLYMAEREAWAISDQRYDQVPSYARASDELLKSSKIQWVGLLFTGENTDVPMGHWIALARHSGWIRGVVNLVIPAEQPKVPRSRFVLLRRAS